MEELAKDLEKQISRMNREFYSYRGRRIYQDMCSDSLELLEPALKKVMREYKICRVIAVVFSVILIFAVLVKMLDLFDFVDLNRLGMLVVFTIMFLNQSYHQHRVSVGLENKMFLIKVLKKSTYIFHSK